MLQKQAKEKILKTTEKGYYILYVESIKGKQLKWSNLFFLHRHIERYLSKKKDQTLNNFYIKIYDKELGLSFEKMKEILNNNNVKYVEEETDVINVYF